jgi:hypothetical protein
MTDNKDAGGANEGAGKVTKVTKEHRRAVREAVYTCLGVEIMDRLLVAGMVIARKLVRLGLMKKADQQAVVQEFWNIATSLENQRLLIRLFYRRCDPLWLGRLAAASTVEEIEACDLLEAFDDLYAAKFGTPRRLQNQINWQKKPKKKPKPPPAES